MLIDISTRGKVRNAAAWGWLDAYHEYGWHVL
jgi:hypothetical protein